MASHISKTLPPPTQPASKPSTQGSGGNVIAAGCSIIGDLTTSGSLRLGGEILGDVTCEGALTVEAGSRIQGRIKASDITVMGTLIGEIIATNRIDVAKGARIEGSIFSPSMRVEGNACVDGDLLISPERSPAHIERAKNLAMLKPASEPDRPAAGT